MPTDSPPVAPHPKLHAVKFQGFLTSLIKLSALAPQLDSLCCHTLVLHAQGVGSNAASSSAHSNKGAAASKRAARNDRNRFVDSSSSGGGGDGGDGGVSGSMSGSGVLPCCRYLAAKGVSIAASDEAEAGQTFAAALPALTVSGRCAQTGQALAAQPGRKHNRQQKRQLGMSCSSRTDIRGS